MMQKHIYTKSSLDEVDAVAMTHRGAEDLFLLVVNHDEEDCEQRVYEGTALEIMDILFQDFFPNCETMDQMLEVCQESGILLTFYTVSNA